MSSTEARIPIGVEAAQSHPVNPKPTIFAQFSLLDRVGIVTGGNRGLGLEMAVALCEAGARLVVCVDLPKEPSTEFSNSKEFVANLSTAGVKSRLEYVSADVTNQHRMWQVAEQAAQIEGRLDFCVACAGVLGHVGDCLEFSDKDFQKVIDVNVNGVFYTAQAAGRQMVKFGTPGSIIMIASMSGSLTNMNVPMVAYNTSKSAVIQMGRSMACELGAKGIRVNTISPGYIETAMTSAFLSRDAGATRKQWSSENPMGRIGRPDELRGVVTWLASDASSFATGSDIMVDGGHHAW